MPSDVDTEASEGELAQLAVVVQVDAGEETGLGRIMIKEDAEWSRTDQVQDQAHDGCRERVGNYHDQGGPGSGRDLRHKRADGEKIMWAIITIRFKD